MYLGPKLTKTNVEDKVVVIKTKEIGYIVSKGYKARIPDIKLIASPIEGETTEKIFTEKDIQLGEEVFEVYIGSYEYGNGEKKWFRKTELCDPEHFIRQSFLDAYKRKGQVITEWKENYETRFITGWFGNVKFQIKEIRLIFYFGDGSFSYNVEHRWRNKRLGSEVFPYIRPDGNKTTNDMFEREFFELKLLENY